MQTTFVPALSKMLVNRKTSFKDSHPLSDFGPDENLNDNADIDWVNKPWVRGLLRFCAFLSLVSVSLNTPEMFALSVHLMYVTFIFDLIVTFLFSAEMIAKMHIRGIVKGEAPYIKDRWCQFDGVMVLCLWMSLILQVFEMTKIVDMYSYWSIMRFPRPLILIRLFREKLKFQLPKQRIETIFKRSRNQIINVTTFFLFFMSLYGILGVQFFGELKNHCVRNGTDPRNVTKADLMIPDYYCSRNPDYGYHCTSGMVCMQLELSNVHRGFDGFDEFITSFFTVYEAASQEGWVFLMYRAIDSLYTELAFVYFITLIFILAWLVKNIFIAVIIESFAEIRVQFQQMWGSRGSATDSDSSQVIQCEGNSWKMVLIDENKAKGFAPPFFQKILCSNFFHTFFLLLVFANAITGATLSFRGQADVRNKLDGFYYAEVAFTVLFDLEVVFKIWCLGFQGYKKRPFHKFELLLAIGTTLHIIPQFYRGHFTYFQVLRVVRLMKASPMLEDFCFKIFGPGKKLGHLILFTMCLLIIASSISLQLFCNIRNFNKFGRFDQAFMSMFQILTQEGWIEVMDGAIEETETGGFFFPLICAIYFILYHQFVTVIVISSFVAVILDNLELDEDIKKLKQLKAREQVTESQQKLPMRLRVFTKFPNHPQMVYLYKIPGDFSLSQIRESVMRQFSTPEVNLTVDIQEISEESTTLVKFSPVKLVRQDVSGSKSGGAMEKRSGITLIVRDSAQQKMQVCGSTQLVPSGPKSLLSQQYQLRMDRRSMRGSRPGSLKTRSTAKENGDIHLGKINSSILNRTRTPDDYDIKVWQQRKQQAEIKRSQQEEDLRENHPLFDTPLFTVGRESQFRKVCQMIVNAQYNHTLRDPITGKELNSKYKRIHKILGLVTYLDWVMIMVTILSCISMAFETPKRRIMNTPELQIAEYVFVICMSIEMGLKVLANGFFFTPKGVVKDFGGMLNLFIYAVSVIFLCWMPQEVKRDSPAQVFLLLRCLRPLRIFVLVPHMRKVVYELIRGFKEIILVSVLLVVLMFMFAIYGVHVLGGKLHKCNDPNITTKEECKGRFFQKVFVTQMKIPNGTESEAGFFVPRTWSNPYNFNFDNIGSAMLALFEVLSLEGWLEVRDVIIERVGLEHAIYVHVFVFMGYMIGLTLFVGVVIANYSENKGTALLTVDQRRWLDLKGRIKLAQPLHIPPRPDGTSFRAKMYDITQHKKFKAATVFLILVNCGLLGVPWKSSNARQTFILGSVSAVCTLLFLCEVIIKMIALTPKGYWTSRRNRFDMLLTFLGVIWIILHFTFNLTGQEGDANNVFGVIIIVLRFCTICGKHAALKMLTQTVVMSVLKSFFIITGMFLLILFYAYLGVILFGTVKHGYNLGRQANFQTTPMAIALLFRIVTGEDWNKIMHDCMVAPPFCTNVGNIWESDCGNGTASIVYFFSFYIIITYIVLNLLVAIIMENFSLFYSNEEDALLNYNDIRNFQNTWNIVDVNRKGSIPVRRVKFLLRLLKGRLEVDLEKERLVFKHMCYEMERLHGGMDVSFHDVISMLSYRSVDICKSLQLEELLARQELEYTIEEEVAKQTIRNWLDSCLKRIRAKLPPQQKEHTNLISNLRATNEQPLFTLTEQPSSAAESSEENRNESPVVRTRKKGMVELQPPNILVQPPPPPTQSPTLRTSPRIEKERPTLKKRSGRLSSGSNFKGLTVNLSQTSEIKGETLAVSPLQKTFTESILIGENVSTNIQSWWGDQFSQNEQEK
ncbi:sodium leak channel NALCN-like isoform X1 [Saccostrea echinata]|uniref:sodium leak channel NALCN-like isoform X1 n=1 Tax=Saccostrea echinata TaxID=191078 RepID=UPI002A7F6DC2|nr:sodium leak channel NALCN-like isoform X1 [Saccostrea echinata]